ncbi:hypothetical protein TNCV_3502501 [Trichonephila clavipes]|uniref:Uncharacterized protein n=1 Tax=Trichonephila clavipes TaxID=2585209 RepID=A0A8X6S042_TRICX|nr:hypothetical protein TNCV_3502501 [Trichonephila clavipes]
MPSDYALSSSQWLHQVPLIQTKRSSPSVQGVEITRLLPNTEYISHKKRYLHQFPSFASMIKLILSDSGGLAATNLAYN